MQPSQKNARPVQDPWTVRIAEKINAGKYTSALAELLPLVQSPAVTAQLLEFTVICYWELKDEKTAFALSDLATQRFPECAAIWSQRGNLALNTGDHVLAQACFRSALQSSPKDLHSLIALNTLEIFPKGSNFDKKLRSALRSKKLSKRELVAVHTAIAQIEQKSGSTRRAFHHYETANQVNIGEYHPDAMEDLLAAQKSVFQPVRSPSTSRSRPSLVLVGGCRVQALRLLKLFCPCIPMSDASAKAQLCKKRCEWPARWPHVGMNQSPIGIGIRSCPKLRLQSCVKSFQKWLG